MFCSFSVIGQTMKFNFTGTVTNIDSGKKEAGLTIAVVQNGSTLFSVVSASNGKYTLTGDIDYSKPFDVVFSKSGVVSKKVYFNLSGMNEEDIPPGSFYQPVQDLSMDIFAERPGVDFSFLNTQPVGKFNWDNQKFVAQLNASEYAQMKSKIEKLLADSEKNAAENEAKYNAAIAEADKQYTAKSYEAALVKYEEALTYKPKETHPINRINEIDAILQKQKEAQLADQQENQEYYNLIQAADNLRNAKDYEKAKAKYQEAYAKKAETYPKDEIAKIDAILKEKENQAAYQAAIEVGDMLLKQKSYKSAKDKYTEASKLKPSEQYPKTKLAEIEAKLKEQEDLDNLKTKYEEAVAAADKLYNEEKWEESKLKYQEALAIEKASTYVSGRIALIDEKLAGLKAEKEKAEKIAMLIKEGNEALMAKKLEESLGKFKEVQTLDAENNVAKAKIPEIEKLIADAAKNAEMEAKFKDFVTKGDAAITAKKLEDGISNYEQALALKVDSEVQTKLTEAKLALEEKLKSDKLNADYTKLITEAKALYDAKNYEEALPKYQEALSLKPNELAPKTKIEEINGILAKRATEKEKIDKINALIAEGEGLITSKSWEPAKAKFNEVIALDAANTIAKEKIKLIDAEILAAQKSAENEAKFNELVSKGDTDLASEKLESAIANYKSALALKSDAGVQQKIDAAQLKLNELADAKAKEAAYLAEIKAADALYTAKKLKEAKTKYESASAMNPNEQHPKDRITEINQILQDQASAEEKANQIKELLADGQTAFTAKDYQTAKSKYEQVLALENTNATADTKLKEVIKAIEDNKLALEKDAEFSALKTEGMSLATQNKLPEAKAKLQEALALKSDAEVKTKIAEIEQTLLAEKNKIDKINTLLADGEKLLSEKKLELAKPKFEQVLTLDANNAQAQTKLAEINTALANLMGEKAKEEQFQALKAQGFDLAKQNQLEPAKQKLKEALTIKSDSEVDAKIAEIDALIAQNQNKQERLNTLLAQGEQAFNSKDFSGAKSKYEEVLTIDVNNAVAKSRLAEIAAELAKLRDVEKQNEAFQKLKEKGFQQADSKDYTSAKSTLNQALAIKADAQIDQKLQEIENAISVASNQAQLEENYTAALKKAQDLEIKRNYADAIASYKEASSLKPSEQLPKAKIVELTSLLNDQNAEKALDEKYLAELKRGDDLVTSGEYVEAIKAYNEALALKPTEQLPVEKAKKAQELADNDKDREIKLQFEKLLTAIENNINNEDLKKAREYVDRAFSLKPDDAKTKSLLQRIEQLEKNNAEFAKLMAQGKDQGDSGAYPEAINTYEKAKILKPTNPEPQQQIDALRQLMASKNENSEKEALFKQYVESGDAKVTAKDYENALSSYQNALNIKPDNSPVKAKVAEVQAILDKIANDKLNAQAKDIEFNELVTKADQLFNEAKYQEAKQVYSEAKEIKPSNSYVQGRIAESDRLNRKETTDALKAEYQKIIKAADQNMANGNYQKAQEYFKRAKGLIPSDPYPRAKLAEIDGILNPVTEGGPTLKPLGEVFDNSVMDGETALNLAKLQVEALKVQQVENELNKIELNEAQRTADKQQSQLETTNEIYDIYKGIAIDNGYREVDHQKTVNIIREGEKSIASTNSDKTNYNYSENLQTQDILDGYELNNTNQFNERNIIATNNHEEVEKIRKQAESLHAEKSGDYYLKNLNTNASLDSIHGIIRTDYIDNQNERIEVAKYVSDLGIDVDRTNSSMTQNKYQSNLESKADINKTVNRIGEINNEKTTYAVVNSEEIKVISDDLTAQQKAQAQAEYQKYIEANSDIENINEKVGYDNVERDLSRVKSVEDLKVIAKDLADKAANQQSIENQKYIQNKEVIDQNNKVNTQITDNAKASLEATIIDVKQIASQTDIKASELNMSDDQSRMQTQVYLDEQKKGVTLKSAEAEQRLKENNEKISDVDKTIANSGTTMQKDKMESVYDTRAQIDKIATAKPSEKPIIKNTLGEEYPEGVSQEVFQNKDENGILKEIITRRVVVIEGRGDVYVKTQTLYATTYKKNGTPITEHVWQMETQKASLVRNY